MFFLSPIDAFVVKFVSEIIKATLAFSPVQWFIWIIGVVICIDALIRRKDFGWFKFGFLFVSLAYALPTIVEIYNVIYKYTHNIWFALFLTVLSIFIGVNVVKWIAREMK